MMLGVNEWIIMKQTICGCNDETWLELSLGFYWCVSVVFIETIKWESHRNRLKKQDSFWVCFFVLFWHTSLSQHKIHVVSVNYLTCKLRQFVTIKLWLCRMINIKMKAITIIDIGWSGKKMYNYCFNNTFFFLKYPKNMN